MLNGAVFTSPPGAVTVVHATMNPGMDAPWVTIHEPVPDLRLHMEHHKAFEVQVVGSFEDLRFLEPCADLITILNLARAEVIDAGVLTSLTQIRTLYGPPICADPLLPALPRLRHLTMTGKHAFGVLAECRQLRELALGVSSYDFMGPSKVPSIESISDLPALPLLQMLSVGGPAVRSLRGIERFTGLRTLRLVGVQLEESAGAEFLAQPFGFADMASLVVRNKAHAQRLLEARLRLDADHVAVEKKPAHAFAPVPEVSRIHPICILLLLDRSRSTEQPVGLDLRVVLDPTAEIHDTTKRYGKGPGGDKRHCDAYTEAINRFLDRFRERVPPAARDHVHVGLIEFGARVDWAWRGALKDRTIIPVADLCDPLQGSPDHPWLEPVAVGETPIGEAMELARLALSEWLNRHPDALPPVVITIGSGRHTGDDVRRHGWGLRRLSTPYGAALVFHIVRENMYGRPQFGVEGYRFSEEEELFSHASRLPDSMAEAAREAQYLFHDPVRGYFDDATEADVENLLHIFTALPGLDWSTDLVRHPLPPYLVPDEEIKKWPWHPPAQLRKPSEWKPPKVAGPMTEDLFWRMIDLSRRGIEEDEEQLDRLILFLEQLEEADLVTWHGILLTTLDRAYRWDLWGVAYLALGGCSDDEFEYFRAWLITQGRKYFEASLVKPSHAARRIAPGDQPTSEGLLSLADSIHRSRTGRVLPQPTTVEQKQPAGLEWAEEDLPRLFPRLARKYG